MSICFAALDCANEKNPDEAARCEYVRDRTTIGHNSYKLKLAMSDVAGNTARAFFLGYFQGYLTFFKAFPGWFKTWQDQRKAHFEHKEDQVCVHPIDPHMQQPPLTELCPVFVRCTLRRIWNHKRCS
jgi:hypothetical protein